MTDNIFDAPDPEAAARDEITSKWKDKPVEELLKAKVESDLYIKTLERQKDELREDYLKQREELLAKAKFEEYIDRMERSNNDSSSDTPVKEVESPKYDPKEIESLVLNKIAESKIVEKEAENFRTVQTKLRERYGNNYPDILKDQQSTLGLSDSDVNALAKKSPEAFFRIMGLNEPRSSDPYQTPPRSSQRNDSFAPKGQPKRNWNYYQELKKADPKLYLDPKIAVQMHNDAVEQGDAFYG